jgi:DNA (cytosine-5)-methyltransferase 1
MNYLSVCSGVEAASVAWKGLDWNPLGFSEIEKFPSEVLKHHYPNVPNLGDMTKYKEWNFGKRSVDLVVGGTPCQSFSVAGLRKGMEDPRGNLALTFCAILDKFRPKWFIWENVPGVLSSNKGRDFGSFLGAVAELGYGASYRVLDAQNFGVPQRRRRVFVIGHLGDWKPTAEVLFEPESLSRHIEESRKKRKDTPRDSTLGIDTSSPLAARDYKDMGTDGLNKTSAKMIPTTAHCLQTTSNDYSRADGFNMIPEKTDALLARDYKGLNSDSLASKAIVEVFENHPSDSRVKEMGDTCQTVTSTWGMGGGNIPFVLGSEQPNAAIAENESPTLTSAMGTGGGHVPILNDTVAYSIREDGQKDNMSVTELGVSNCLSSHQPSIMSHHAQTFVMDQKVAHGFEPGIAKREGNPSRFTEEKSPTLRANMGDNQVAVAKQMAVRKLTPVECERLQGFPDNYTNIKENCPDGHRYKAMGNSMAVPVMRWIGERINNYKEVQDEIS